MLGVLEREKSFLKLQKKIDTFKILQFVTANTAICNPIGRAAAAVQFLLLSIICDSLKSESVCSTVSYECSIVHVFRIEGKTMKLGTRKLSLSLGLRKKIPISSHVRLHRKTAEASAGCSRLDSFSSFRDQFHELVADQLGHSLDVSQSAYARFLVGRGRRPSSNLKRRR
jgi:hypothetical protein